ncbi:hypothetical protein BDN72DRAFT_831549 [Pluteus cervinus]|uniref:Uncharacterized protein n=1 Tax=Pluteus cervinus TaxID=181527 RepID=A0ACD3BEM3_9AGAR|nr:hypothetical protein BDN72DRAFT_831549 [Pluteus cervinus]
MFIFNGKLNWSKNAENECFTVVVPAGFALNDLISAHWQWTVDSKGRKQYNVSQLGVIDKVFQTPQEYRINFSFSYYTFDAVVAHDFSSLTVTMRNPSGASNRPTVLAKQFADASRVSPTGVYTGKLNWFRFAVNEMITVVIPAGISDGAPCSLFYQWTVDSKGNVKANSCQKGTLSSVRKSGNSVTGTLKGSYYTYEITISNGTQGTIVISNPAGESTSNSVVRFNC